MTCPGKLVVDASVAIKWYIPEVGGPQADAVLQRGDKLLSPDLLLAELGNVLWKKVRRGELSQSEAGEIVEVFISSSPIDCRPARQLLRPAFDIASLCGCTVYDALYLALAVVEACHFVTADERLARTIRETGLRNTILSLSDIES